VGQGLLWKERGRCEKEDSLDGGMVEGENPQSCWRCCFGTKNEKIYRDTTPIYTNGHFMLISCSWLYFE